MACPIHARLQICNERNGTYSFMLPTARVVDNALVYGNCDIIFDHFSRSAQLYAIPRGPQVCYTWWVADWCLQFDVLSTIGLQDAAGRAAAVVPVEPHEV